MSHDEPTLTYGKMMLLPPKPGLCSVCATDHKPYEAHNVQSIYYGMRFQMEYGRSPTWEDAVAHLTLLEREQWKTAFLEVAGTRGYKWTSPPEGTEPIAEPYQCQS